ncbi:MAG: Rpn family recombination-promoting nuclease/putative transposase, partial [Roseburia sp.]|nr:Rpn family recombination-promoting nuclease/putative transposase [Roseburia sp.]
VNFALIGIESQETVDYKFPLRSLHYEVNQYEKQAAKIKREVQSNGRGLSAGEYLYGYKKDSRLYPVITFVIYSGKEPWDGPMSLHEIIDFTDIPEELRSKVADYSINLIDIRRLEDTSIFQTDVKHVFDFIRCAESKEKLYELVSREPYYQAMDAEAFEVVSMYTNSKELAGIKKYEGKDGKKDVCQAIKDLMADSRQEGREEGMAEGIEQTKIENARNLLELLSDEVIAEKIGLPLERVKALHEQA